MGAVTHITTNYKGKSWMGTTDAGTEIEMGSGVDRAAPYELLLMALSGCLYATFEETTRKMRAEFSSVYFDITGEKRDEIPSTLKHVSIKGVVHRTDNEKKVRKAFETATRYCSVYNTLSKVAEMEWSLEFKD